MDGFFADNQSYRRGQALGFTVAELFTLLLFLVLLILAAEEQHKNSAAQAAQRKLDRVEHELKDATNRAKVLADRDNRLRQYFGVPNDFGDDFADLIPGAHNKSSAQRQESLREKAQAADEIDRLLNVSASAQKESIKGESEYDPKSLPGQVKSCIDEKQRLQRQIANVEKRYGGGGTVFPSCWVTSNGGTAFVFDIDLLSRADGGRLMIHDDQVPGHDDEKGHLFNSVQFNEPITDSAFLDETRQFYDFGVKQQPECRFFVRVNDRTAPQDKAVFKELLLTVEKNFYKAWGSGE